MAYSPTRRNMTAGPAKQRLVHRAVASFALKSTRLPLNLTIFTHLGHRCTLFRTKVDTALPEIGKFQTIQHTCALFDQKLATVLSSGHPINHLPTSSPFLDLTPGTKQAERALWCSSRKWVSIKKCKSPRILSITTSGHYRSRIRGHIRRETISRIRSTSRRYFLRNCHKVLCHSPQTS